jgi:hypothetical protein
MKLYRLLAVIVVLTSAIAGSITQAVAAPQQHDYLIPPRTLTDSLLAYWTLDEASSTRFDSLTGCGGGGCNLTDNNTVTQAAGKLSNAAQFTSANSEWLNHVDDATLSAGNTNFTIAVWVYLDSTATTMGLAGKAPGGTSNEYAIVYNSGNNRFQWWVWSDGGAGSTGISATAFGAISGTTWYYVIGWHDADNDIIGISVNGIQNSQSYAAGIYNSAGVFEVGRYIGGNYVNGRIDALCLWRRVLAVDERTWLYNAGNGCEYPFTACDATATATAAASDTPTATMTSTITPTWTATATPPIWESHVLDGGNLYVIERRATYGEIAVAVIGLLVLAAFGLRWIFQLVMGAFQQWLL